jgi:hypothetical protein
MATLIWLRRLVIVLLLAVLLLALCAAYAIFDTAVRVVVVGGYGLAAPTCLWLDRKLTTRLRLKVLATRLESSGEQFPGAPHAGQHSGD